MKIFSNLTNFNLKKTNKTAFPSVIFIQQNTNTSKRHLAMKDNTPDIEVCLGGAEAIKESDSFDYVIANINRNILLADICNYVKAMHSGSRLFISGFYTDDMEVLKEEAAKHGLQYIDYAEDNRWAMMQFEKN